MNSIDLATLVIAGVFGGLGLYWGFIRQVLAFVGLVAGVVLASRYGGQVAEWLSSLVASDTLANTLGFIVVLLAVNAAASLAATLLRRFVGLLFLGWLDHLLGGVLGLVQAVLTCTVLLIVAAAFPHPLWVSSLKMSRFAPALVQAFGFVFALLPPSFRISAAMTFGL